MYVNYLLIGIGVILILGLILFFSCMSHLNRPHKKEQTKKYNKTFDALYSLNHDYKKSKVKETKETLDGYQLEIITKNNIEIEIYTLIKIYRDNISIKTREKLKKDIENLLQVDICCYWSDKPYLNDILDGVCNRIAYRLYEPNTYIKLFHLIKNAEQEYISYYRQLQEDVSKIPFNSYIRLGDDYSKTLWYNQFENILTTIKDKYSERVVEATTDIFLKK